MKYNKDNPLRVFIAFAGYDSQSLALQRLKEDYPEFDFVRVGWAEFDPQSKKPIDEQPAVIANRALFHDGSRNYGDITSIMWQDVPDFDLFTYSFPCFPAGTLVLTHDGYKVIEEVIDGDLVLTHTNNFQKVNHTMQRSYSGNVVHLRGMCFDDVYCTENHPFLTRKRYRYGHKCIRCFTKPEWVHAKDLTRDCFIGYAVNTKSEIPKWDGSIDNRWGHSKKVNNLRHLLEKTDFWYLMGRYVGDGWRRTSKTGSRIVICCSDRNKKSLVDAISACGLNYSEAKERTVYKFHICMNELYDFVGRFGYMAYGKRIDGETMNLPVHLLESFLKGYVDSDGCKIGKFYKTTSISKELCYGVAQCVAKVYHRPFSLYRTARKPKTIIEGREVNQRDSYSLVWKLSTDTQDKAFYEDGYIWFPINSIETKEDVCQVYNLSVDVDESYTANGCIVHNCTDISNAGRQAGLEKGSGTRSSLLWECERAIEIKRPKYLLMENVKALLSKKFKPYWAAWTEILEGYGYKTFTEILNAKDFGVAQNRERVFGVSILRTEDEPEPIYHFPKPFPLTSCLADVLDEDVDEKYFLSDEMLARFCVKSVEQDDPMPTSKMPLGINGCQNTKLDVCANCKFDLSTEQCARLYSLMEKHGKTPLGAKYP